MIITDHFDMALIMEVSCCGRPLHDQTLLSVTTLSAKLDSKLAVKDSAGVDGIVLKYVIECNPFFLLGGQWRSFSLQNSEPLDVGGNYHVGRVPLRPAPEAGSLH
jgi:hypothetical protein